MFSTIRHQRYITKHQLRHTKHQRTRHQDTTRHQSLSMHFSYLETTYPEYLTDHHQRPNELLLSVPVGPSHQTHDVHRELLAELSLQSLPDTEHQLAISLINQYFASLPASRRWYTTEFFEHFWLEDADWPRAFFVLYHPPVTSHQP